MGHVSDPDDPVLYSFFTQEELAHWSVIGNADHYRAIWDNRSGEVPSGLPRSYSLPSGRRRDILFNDAEQFEEQMLVRRVREPLSSYNRGNGSRLYQSDITEADFRQVADSSRDQGELSSMETVTYMDNQQLSSFGVVPGYSLGRQSTSTSLDDGWQSDYPDEYQISTTTFRLNFYGVWTPM